MVTPSPQLQSLWEVLETADGRSFALKYFQRNSAVFINGHLGMEEDVGRAGSTSCHWCLVPFKLLQTGPVFTLEAVACTVFALLLYSKQAAAALWSLLESQALGP